MKTMFFLIGLAWGAVAAPQPGQVQVVEGVPQHEVTGYAPPADGTVLQAAPRHIILMIGDGMSTEHIAAAWVCNGGKLNMDSLPYTGWCRTFSANRLITDSAAAGTALACGAKTNNGMLGITPAGQVLPSLCVRLSAPPYGKQCGLVVTKAITDATPAAFYAHVPGRKLTSVIAQQLEQAGLRYLAGGGKGAFSAARLEKMKSAPGAVVSLCAEGDCLYAAERGNILAEETRRALACLEAAPQGFFLMIEGSKIDSASHDTHLGRAVEEVLDFDRALGVVLRWMQKHPDTLLVVTADHQTGGLVILDGNVAAGRVKASFATSAHTGIVVPVLAAGARACLFSGVMDNTQIPARIMQAVEK